MTDLFERSLIEGNNEVFLCQYDLEKGHGSASILGRNAAHYTIRAYGKEFSHNPEGVKIEWAGNVKAPMKGIKKLGETHLSEKQIYVEVVKLSSGSFKKYSLLDANCIDFSEKLTNILCETSIPDPVLQLVPNTLINVCVALGAGAATLMLLLSFNGSKQSKQ